MPRWCMSPHLASSELGVEVVRSPYRLQRMEVGTLDDQRSPRAVHAPSCERKNRFRIIPYSAIPPTRYRQSSRGSAFSLTLWRSNCHVVAVRRAQSLRSGSDV